MSAYGTINSSSSSTILPETLWHTKSHSPTTPSYLTLHHLNRSRALSPPGLVEVLHTAFAQIIDEGATYPQETLQGESYTRDAFEAYFLGGDLILGVVGSNAELGGTKEGGSVEVDLEKARAGRDWAECVAGFYYVKPNYPGRSSHICNGGFVVPTRHRGSGYGTVLAKSFLYYAPALGYQASVFNLVYVNNAASVRLWETLGFEKAGRIPRAGRLKRADGQGEEYVDAWVFYKSFTDAASAPQK